MDAYPICNTKKFLSFHAVIKKCRRARWEDHTEFVGVCGTSTHRQTQQGNVKYRQGVSSGVEKVHAAKFNQ